MNSAILPTATRPRPRDVDSPNDVCPIDLRPLSRVPVTALDDVRACVARARSAQEAWALRSIEERGNVLKAAAKAMLDARAEVLRLAKEELGKFEVEGLFTEGLGPLDTVNGWVSVVSRAARPRRTFLNPLSFPGKSASVELVPRGVVGVIAPWNFPVAGLYRSVFPALLTGNGVVIKPSERSPRTSAWFVDVLARFLPAGLVSVVHGDATVGAHLLDSGIDACVFTGSLGGGAKVRTRCAELGIPSSVEMGGKDAALVLADCNLEKTLAGITHWALMNVGQACGAIEVAYVDRRIADEFVERLRATWTKLRVGTQFDARPGDVDVSPLANAQQLAVVERHVADAIGKGAKLVCGGGRVGRGFGYLPTVLDHCTASMDVVREETFGPVLAVVRVEGVTDAIRQINASPYGLGASIWTRDIARARRLATRLEVGIVTVNNHAFTGAVPALPWTGTKATGFGVANSAASLLTFARPKTLVIDRADDPEPFFLPYDDALLRLGHLLSRAQLGDVREAWRIPLLLRERTRRVREFFRRD